MIIISSHNASSVIKILITRFQKGNTFTNLNGNPRNPTQCRAHIMAIEYFGSRKTNLAVKIGELTFLRHQKAYFLFASMDWTLHSGRNEMVYFIPARMDVSFRPAWNGQFSSDRNRLSKLKMVLSKHLKETVMKLSKSKV